MYTDWFYKLHAGCQWESPKYISISFPPASAVEGIKSVPSVCVSVIQLSHNLTVWGTDAKFGDILTSFDYFWARILTKRACRGRARQRSVVFINHVNSHLSVCIWLWLRAKHQNLSLNCCVSPIFGITLTSVPTPMKRLSSMFKALVFCNLLLISVH